MSVPMAGVLIKKRNLVTDTQGERCVKTGILLAEAKELPEARRPGTVPSLASTEGARPH